MDNSPIMRASDEEFKQEFKMSSDQKKAVWLTVIIQSVMIVITYALFLAQLLTGIKTGVGCIATIVVFMVIYLNFLKIAGFLAERGIKSAAVNLFKIISPILYFVAFILCITTMV